MWAQTFQTNMSTVLEMQNILINDQRRKSLESSKSFLSQDQAAPSPGWGPQGQGPSKNRQGSGKNNLTDQVPSGLPDKNFGIFGHFYFLGINNKCMS